MPTRSMWRGRTLSRLAGLMGLALFSILLMAIAASAVQAFLLDPHPIEPKGCGVMLTVGPGDPGPDPTYKVRVLLALDEAWLAELGERAERQARSVLRDVAYLFRPFGIQLVATQLVHWRSDHLPISSDHLLAEVERSVGLNGADLVLAFTGLRPQGVHGAARIGGKYALVSHHPGHPERDRLVSAHELGHLFGLWHSTGGTEGADIMAKNGFDKDPEWSSCHKRLLRLNASRFKHEAEALAQDLGP